MENVFYYLILFTLIFSFLLNLTSKLLNIKNLKLPIPEEFIEHYRNEEFAKMQSYNYYRTYFGIIVESLDLFLLLFFWHFEGFKILNELVQSLSSVSIIQGLIFISILFLLQSIIKLPFSIYSTFVIEEKFGFNRTTIKTFFMDKFKALGLGIVIGLPVFALILYFFESFGELAWIYCWGFVVIFSLLIQYIAPNWIMPMFNKFTPLEENSLKEKIIALAKSVDFPITNVFVIDGSKRSNKANAYFTGFGKNKRIALFDTLIQNHSEEEIIAVLAHEIGHYKHKHILKSMLISIFHTGFTLYLLSIFLYNSDLYSVFYIDGIYIFIGFIFFGLLYSPIELILSIFLNILSRKNEFEADAYAIKATKNQNDMINALKKLSLSNLSNLNPHPFFSFLHYSHPPVIERIIAIKKIEIKN